MAEFEPNQSNTAHDKYRAAVEENLGGAKDLMKETIADYNAGDADAVDLTVAGLLLTEAETVEEESRAI